MRRPIIFLLLLFCLFSAAFAEDTTGTVYIVCGSDASIWDGLNISVYDNRLFDGDVYSDPDENGYAVMDTAFRLNLRDSYGTPLKMTWWMMAGNVFRMSNNCDVPTRNNITLHLIKKYHMDRVNLYDDVLTLHYHNYHWSDTNDDGRYYWNQGLDFRDNQEDFELCLMKFLIDDHVFPVSFRSGWHYMDNYWQAYMDRFIPFQMGCAYPSNGGDYSEPTNNIIDWSMSPSDFKPFHPSPDNYQIPGSCRGWQLRSTYYTNINSTYHSLWDCFETAAEGEDQMVCLWSHIPEDVFVPNLDTLNRYAHEFSQQYGVKFRYCGDAEAMRLWINPDDTIAPVLNVEELIDGGQVRYRLTTDGPIFQKDEPFVAIKTIYETYQRLDCQKIGTNSWETITPIEMSILANFAVSVCDSVGNQTNEYIDYIKDDIYIDDADSAQIQYSGNWVQTEDAKKVYWNREAQMASGTASFTATPDIPVSGTYGIFFHGPKSSSDSVRYIIDGSSGIDTVYVNKRLYGSHNWQPIGFYDLNAGSGNSVIVENLNDNQDLGLDVIRFTSLVPEKKLELSRSEIYFGEVSTYDSVETELILNNSGSKEIHISDISFYGNNLILDSETPLTLAPMTSDTLTVTFFSDYFMDYNDIIVIRSDDALEPVKLLHVQANATSFFQIVDNEEADNYSEHGDWGTSVVEAWGTSSRYSYLSSGSYADFNTELVFSGSYDVQFIHPNTVNSTNHALYIVMIDGTPVDTVVVDQNEGSGAFVSLGKEFELPADTPITLRIGYYGGNTYESGVVLRADAVRFILLNEHEITSLASADHPKSYSLYDNYPNPFNPSTAIHFDLPEAESVKIDIFDLSGRKIRTLADRYFDAGRYRIDWHPDNISSGVYLYRITAGSWSDVKKCSYIK